MALMPISQSAFALHSAEAKSASYSSPFFRREKPSLIALSSIALGKPVQSSLAVLGEISISGTMIKVDELANALQVCLDSGAKKVLLPITSAADLGTVPSELIGCFNLIFYSSAEDAVFKALGVE